MASIKQDLTARYQLTRDAEMNETHFSQGDRVEIVATWPNHYLVKDADGHFYNLEKNKVQK